MADTSGRLLETIADLGRLRVSTRGLERQVAESAGAWLEAATARLATDPGPEERLALRAEVAGLVEALLVVAATGRANRVLGRAFGLLVALEAELEGGSALLRRLVGERIASRAQAEPSLVLVLNPGSTSTKVAVFEGLARRHEFEVHLSPGAPDGVEPRARAILAWLGEAGVDLTRLDGIACRGGFLKPVPTGTYRVVPEMVRDLESPRIAHASNMAIPIGLKIAQLAGREHEILVTTSDPVVSDEIDPVERLTGFAKLKRDGTGAHYLNHRAVWRTLASLADRAPEGFGAITAHVGGGVSFARHDGGRVTALVDAFSGVPSANRCGTLDLPRLLSALKRDDVTLKEVEGVVYSRGGLLSLAGTNDFRALSAFREKGATAAQRAKIDLVLDFYGRQFASAILRLAADGRPVDVVAFTGGLARATDLVARVSANLAGRFPLVVVPGSFEHEALAAGLLCGLHDPASFKDYVRERDALHARRGAEDKLLDTLVFERPVLFKKEGAPLTTLDEVIDAARLAVRDLPEPPRIGIVGADNDEALLAARRANDEGRYRVATFSLIGDSEAINAAAYETDLVLDGNHYEVVDTDEPVAEAVRLLDQGRLQLLMKGSLHTDEILRGVFRYLKSSGRLGPDDLVSHVLVADIPVRNKLVLITDAAVNPYPDEEKRVRILENALKVASALHIHRPHVAVVSAIENVNRSVASSLEAERIAARFADRTDCRVEGPLSFDVAMDPDIAREKGYGGQVRGTADILLMPDIDAGNVLYKTLTTQSGATVAGVIVAGDLGLVLTSRGDSARSKLASISLAVKLWIDRNDAKRKA